MESYSGMILNRIKQVEELRKHQSVLSVGDVHGPLYYLNVLAEQFSTMVIKLLIVYVITWHSIIIDSIAHTLSMGFYGIINYYTKICISFILRLYDLLR